MPNMIKLCEGKSIGANEFKYLEQALSAFEISNHGRFVSLFEEKLKEYLKTKKIYFGIKFRNFCNTFGTFTVRCKKRR